MSIATLVTFIIYFAVVLAVGWYCCGKNESIEDYLLGGRQMGSLVTAISAEASDMSGWLLMGLPGAIYLGGVKNVWIAVGLFLGTILNWVLVAGRHHGGDHVHDRFPASGLLVRFDRGSAPQENIRVLQQFDEVARELRDMGRPAAAPQVNYGARDGGV